MNDQIKNIETTIVMGDQKIEAIRNDPQLSTQGKNELIAKMTEVVKQTVQEQADILMAIVSKDFEKSQAEVDAQAAAFQNGMDWARLNYWGVVGQSQVASEIQDNVLAHIVAASAKTGDLERLHTIKNIVLPQLLRDSSYRARNPNIEDVAQVVDNTLSNMEPESLKVARTRAAQAAQAMSEAATVLQDLDYKWSLTKGGKLLEIQEPVESSYTGFGRTQASESNPDGVRTHYSLEPGTRWI